MGVPSRRPGKSYCANTGVIQSHKDGSSQAYHSGLERDLLLLVDFDPTVASYQAQPETFYYENSKGKNTRYTPDLRIDFHPEPDGTPRPTWLVEVKGRSDLWEIWPDYHERLKVARKIATDRGWKFHVLTEYEIRTKYLAAITPYLSFVGCEAPEPLRSRLLAAMARMTECTTKDLIEAVVPEFPLADVQYALRCLIASRQIWVDFSKPHLRPNSTLRSAAADSTFLWGVDGPPLRVRRKDDGAKPVSPSSGPVFFRLQPGVEASVNGQLCTILALGDYTSSYVKFHSSGKRDLVPNASILPPATGPAPCVLPELESIAPEKLACAEKRLDAIKPLLHEKRPNRFMVLDACDELGCSQATLYRYLRKYQQTGVMTSLLPVSPSGGRGKSRSDEVVSKILDDMIENRYLTTQKLPATKVYKDIESLCSDLKIKAPHINTLYHKISQISDYEKIKRREGFQVAKNIFDSSRGSLISTRPLQLTEMDHSPTDMFLVDPITRKIIGRAYITVIIDVFSRMILGFYISLDAPSATSVGLCLANAVLPKTKFLKKFNIESEWPCYGLPEVIATDNAGEFSGSYMSNICKQYGINMQWRPLAHPEFGGHIERIIGTLCKEMHCMPGTTFSDVKERGSYPSESQASMTLEEFEAAMALYICDVYHNSPHEGIDFLTPLERYKEGIFGSDRMTGFGFPRTIAPANEEKFRLDMLPFVERAVNGDGISIECIKYKDACLSKYRKLSNLDEGKKYIIRYDPRAMNIVYLWDQDQQTYFPIPYADLTHEVVSLWEIKAAKRWLKERGMDASNEVAIFSAIKKMRQIQETAVATTKTLREQVKRKNHREHAIHDGLEINKKKNKKIKLSDVQEVVNGPQIVNLHDSEDEVETPGVIPFRLPVRKFSSRRD